MKFRTNVSTALYDILKRYSFEKENFSIREEVLCQMCVLESEQDLPSLPENDDGNANNYN